MATATTGKILLWTFVLGLLLNALGWSGNQFILGDDWDAANARALAGFAPPWPPLVKEAMSLVSDFVYAFLLVWMYANARVKALGFALRLAVVVWLGGAAVTYLAIVNAGFLPWEIAVKTSLLALATFIAAAPLLAFAFRD